MKTVSLQITYRKGKPFAAYIYLSRRFDGAKKCPD